MRFKKILLVVSALCLTSSLDANPPKTSLSRGRLTFSTGKKIPYYRTHPLNSQHDDIRTVVIVVHGLRRNADDYFAHVVDAANRANVMDQTAVLAPHFQTSDDAPRFDEYFWSDGWSKGHQSVNSPRFSSFRCIDEMIRKICRTGVFPRLERIVIAGHSAGGQFVNRYVAGGRFSLPPSLSSRFLVMNPSSYLYINGRRVALGRDFRIPSDGGDYNDYKYGLDNLNTYMAETGQPKIRANVFSRKTYYLGGVEDVGSTNLDRRPAAMFQGKNRYERFRVYKDYVQLFPEWKDNTTFIRVDGIGHSGRQMFLSDQAAVVMFK